VNETLYRRPLPPDMVAFSSVEGRRLFAEALAAGGLDGYFPIAEQFHTQSDPSFCGLGSLVVALNALGIDPGRLWKGPWRWFAEELLDCCVPLAEVKERGLDIEELGCLARCNGAEVELVHADASDVDTFRDAVRAAAAGGTVLVSSYDRAALDQTGSGHFSPIGGYHAARDLVLVLDVARFKYPPHWVETERLFRAMQSVDPTAGRARGWMVLRGRQRGIALGFSVMCDSEGWAGLAERMESLKVELKWAADLPSIARALLPLVAHLELRTPSAAAHRDALAVARATLRALHVHRQVEQAIGHDHAEATTLLLLSISDLLPSARRAEVDVLLPNVPEHAVLAAEVGNVRAQLGALWTHARQKA
jgi:glutathione gamma-glutamylcysteinyltransferase